MKRKREERERERERERGEVGCGCTYWIAPQGTGRHPAPGVGRAPGLLDPAPHAAGARLPRVGSSGGVRITLHTPRVAQRCKGHRVGANESQPAYKVLQLSSASLHIQIVRFVNLLFPGCGKVWW